MTAAILPCILDLGKNSSLVWSSGQIARRCSVRLGSARQIRCAELRPADGEVAVSLLELLTPLLYSRTPPPQPTRLQPSLQMQLICRRILQLPDFQLVRSRQTVIRAIASSRKAWGNFRMKRSISLSVLE